jgi:Beta-ketoacyl synthase, N-terminal domain
MPMDHVTGSNTAVYVGSAFNHDFQAVANTDLDAGLKYRGNGTSLAMMSNRISWFYDFKGTSMTVDTACSSSLVSLHHACVNLQRGESEMVQIPSIPYSLNHSSCATSLNQQTGNCQRSKHHCASDCVFDAFRSFLPLPRRQELQFR